MEVNQQCFVKALHVTNHCFNTDQVDPLVMKLWGKSEPFHPLVCHMVDVGHVAQALLRTSTFRNVKFRLSQAMNTPLEVLDAWIGYLSAHHDWGKGWPIFQSRGSDELLFELRNAGLSFIVEKQEAKVRHEIISAMWLDEHLRNCFKWDNKSARTVAGAISLHHGWIHHDINSLYEFPGKDKWNTLRLHIEQMIREAFGPVELPIEIRDHSTAGMLLSGLIVWSDWIASNEKLFKLRWQGESWPEYILKSRAEAQHAVRQLGLDNVTPWKNKRTFQSIWPQLSSPRPTQIACENMVETGIEGGLTIIEAPMGEGKSEAALYLASQWIQDGGGIYLALPTAATSNQMFDRLKNFIKHHHPEAETQVQLVHGTSWMVDQISSEKPIDIDSEEPNKPEGDIAADWFRPKKRSLLATYGVGTIDQVLMSVLHVKFGFLRLLGITSKVLIIDEVHAYDAYMTQILTLLLRWCATLHIPVIMLSATLPRSRKKELIKAYLGDNAPISGECDLERGEPYPLITHVTRDGKLSLFSVPHPERQQRVHIKTHYGMLNDPARVADLVEARMTERGEGCFCVIANTVDTAQKIYKELEQRLPDVPKILFHSRYTVERRNEIEEQVLAWFDKRSLLPKDDPRRTERPKKAILVATQVVEQSLDLDFDEMFTDIAPIDLILQRVGRLWRHMRPNRHGVPIVHIALPKQGEFDFGSTGRVYHPYILIKTCLALKEEWVLPQDIRDIVESVYGERDIDNQVLTPILCKARNEWEQQIGSQAQSANQYLIPAPYERAFKLLRTANPTYEEDEKVRTYFAAKTRYGDRTLRVLAIEEEKDLELITRETPPLKDQLKLLLLRTVNLPEWWLEDAITSDAPQVPKWLPVDYIIVLKNQRWIGHSRKNGQIEIVNDSTLGFMRVTREG